MSDPRKDERSAPPAGPWGVVLFPSVQGAVMGERLLQRAGLEQKLIPIPRHLSSGCGFCLRFVWRDQESVAALLDEKNVTYEQILPLEPS